MLIVTATIITRQSAIADFAPDAQFSDATFMFVYLKLFLKNRD